MELDAWAVFVLRSFSSPFQSVHHLKQIKSLTNKQARCYEVGKHRRRVLGFREQDETEIKPWEAVWSVPVLRLVMKQMKSRTKRGRTGVQIALREQNFVVCNFICSEAYFWTSMNRRRCRLLFLFSWDSITHKLCLKLIQSDSWGKAASLTAGVEMVELDDYRRSSKL